MDRVRREQSRGSISLMMPIHGAQWELAGIVHAVSTAFETAGRLVAVQCTHSDWRRERRLIHEAYQTHAAGVILYAADDTQNVDLLGRLRLDGYPIVLIDSRSRQVDLPYVASDNVAGGALQARSILDAEVADAFYLISSERSTPPLASRSSIRDRYLGFFEELRRLRPEAPAYGEIEMDNRLLSVDREVLKAAESASRENPDRIDWLDRWLDRVSFPIGLACLNDGVARWLIDYLCFRGVRVPADVRVVGFDDSPMHVGGAVGISSVKQDFAGMGQVAADVLLRLIHGSTIERDKVILPVQPVYRDSTIQS